MFIPGNLDDEFYALDKVIDDYARSLEGFVGVDRWWSKDSTAKNVVYFFTDHETVTTFAKFPEHVRAKRPMPNGTRATKSSSLKSQRPTVMARCPV